MAKIDIGPQFNAQCDGTSVSWSRVINGRTYDFCVIYTGTSVQISAELTYDEIPDDPDAQYISHNILIHTA